MIWFESPTNPLLCISNISEIVSLAKSHNITTVCDNTFATPILQNPLLLGIDIVFHSCTKYIGGHSDVLAGVVTTSNENLHKEIRKNRVQLGAMLSTFDAYLLIRSLKTLKI